MKYEITYRSVVEVKSLRDAFNSAQGLLDYLCEEDSPECLVVASIILVDKETAE